MAITIRDADESDVDLLVELSRIGQELHADALPAYFERHESRAAAAWIRSRLGRAESRTWIARAGDVPVGYVVAVVRDRPGDARCKPRRTCEIEEIAVSPAHRRQGVARALVDRVLADARARGIRDVELTSWSFNADAHRAFEALGFRPRIVRFGRDSGTRS